ncbi:MAG: trypsin-like peptidase domain-containing protein [Bacteroidales bacterium]
MGVNNNSSGKLPTMPVPGERIIIEYHIPSDASMSGTLGITQVSHDFLGVFGNEAKDGRFGLSSSCNVDINCSDGTTSQVVKNSVCRILVKGTELCSGVLVNNTNQQNKAILITASHCITTSDDASKSLFVFGYESGYCSGYDGRVLHSISGSVLRAVNTEVDFAVVELSSFPPMTYKPYLAGWDVTGTAPSSSVSIHHPLGDVKKISTDNNTAFSSTYTGLLANGCWRIGEWEKGTTEGGSSGAPLFDQNRRVVGVLIGGEAVCGRSVNDYFAKSSAMYNTSSLLWEQLKGWIDPAQSGVKQLNGRDPYAPNWLTADTLTNISSVESLVNTPYTLPAIGQLTGYNSDSVTMYAEHFSTTAGKQVIEVLINLGKTNWLFNSDSIRVYLFNDGSQPGTVAASQRIYMNEVKDNFLLKVDFKNPIPVNTGFYVGWKFKYTLKATNESRQFAVFHVPDRGSVLLNTAWFHDGTSWKKFTQHPRIPIATSLDARVVVTSNSTVNGVEKVTARKDEFLVYPNPAAIDLKVDLPPGHDDVEIFISDISGRLVYSRSYEPWFGGPAIIPVYNIPDGAYLLKVHSKGKVETHKVLIIK